MRRPPGHTGHPLLQESFNHLAATGHLVCYGFHSNVPKGAEWLSPSAWVRMAFGMARLPHFDPMELVTTSRSVSGFNLSFFADEDELIAKCVYPKVAVTALTLSLAVGLSGAQWKLRAFALLIFGRGSLGLHVFDPIFPRYFEQIEAWVTEGAIRAPDVTVFEGIDSIADAQRAIQSGTTVGKVIVRV